MIKNDEVEIGYLIEGVKSGKSKRVGIITFRPDELIAQIKINEKLVDWALYGADGKKLRWGFNGNVEQTIEGIEFEFGKFKWEIVGCE